MMPKGMSEQSQVCMNMRVILLVLPDAREGRMHGRKRNGVKGLMGGDSTFILFLFFSFILCCFGLVGID